MKMLYSIAGRVLSVHTFDEWSTSAVSDLVDGWLVRALVNSDAVADATLKVTTSTVLPEIPSDLSTFEISDAGTCHTDQKTFYLDFDGALIRIDPPSEVTMWVNPEDLDATTRSRVLSQGISAALRRCGLFELHSGAVVPPEEANAVLIVGASGSGKSTLTASLAASGWSYLSDDTVLLRNDVDGVQAIALRQFFALTPTTVATLPAMRTTASGNGRKNRFTPQQFFPGHQIESAKPNMILFPTVTGAPVTRLEKLGNSETMSRLLKLCPWACYDPISATNHLTTLGRLARETTGFGILAGTDLLHDTQLAADLISQVYSRN